MSGVSKLPWPQPVERRSPKQHGAINIWSFALHSLDSEHSLSLHSLYSRLCTLATVLSHCTDTLCIHNLCTLDFGFSHSLHSVTLYCVTLYSRTVLSSCTLLPPLDSVPLHSLHPRLCTLATLLSHLRAQCEVMLFFYSKCHK